MIWKIKLSHQDVLALEQRIKDCVLNGDNPYELMQLADDLFIYPDEQENEE